MCSGICWVQVDIHTWKSKTHRIHAQIKDLCAILCGLVVASDYRKGQALVTDRSFKNNELFFQVCCLPSEPTSRLLGAPVEAGLTAWEMYAMVWRAALQQLVKAMPNHSV